MGFLITLFRIKRRFVAYTVAFSIFFILGYITGCILGIYTFRPEGLIYWYAVGMVCGIAVYLLKNRGLSSTS